MHIFMSTILQGLVFGIIMAAIPGPIFFLIVQRTLAEGALTGFLCALGAVSADAVYALIAAVGLTFITEFLLAHQAVLAIGGGVFLIYLGITIFMRTVHQQVCEIHDKRLLYAWLSTFLLTVANPVTILSYCVIFAGLGIDTKHDMAATWSLVMGVIIGALSVVLLLISFLKFFRQKISVEILTLINKAAGILLICFGLAALFRGILSLKHC